MCTVHIVLYLYICPVLFSQYDYENMYVHCCTNNLYDSVKCVLLHSQYDSVICTVLYSLYYSVKCTVLYSAQSPVFFVLHTVIDLTGMMHYEYPAGKNTKQSCIFCRSLFLTLVGFSKTCHTKNSSNLTGLLFLCCTLHLILKTSVCNLMVVETVFFFQAATIPRFTCIVQLVCVLHLVFNCIG